MVGIFKRAAGLNLVNQQAAQTSFLQPGASATAGGLESDRKMTRLVDECLKAYTGLAIGSGFVEFEDQNGLSGNGIASGAGSGSGSGSGRNAFGGSGGFT